MTSQKALQQLLATVDARELNSLRWGPMRLMFPRFVEEIELARYIKRLLAEGEPKMVAIEPHRDAAGRVSSHVFDVYRVLEVEPAR
jgi:hypothetical protein